LSNQTKYLLLKKGCIGNSLKQILAQQKQIEFWRQELLSTSVCTDSEINEIYKARENVD